MTGGFLLSLYANFILLKTAYSSHKQKSTQAAYLTKQQKSIFA